MSLTFAETFESGDGTTGLSVADTLIARIYSDGDPVADGADDIIAVTAYAETLFPPILATGTVLVDIDRKRLSAYQWIFTGKYRARTDQRPTNDASFSFNTGGGTTHITHSRATSGQWSAPHINAFDFKQGINATKDSIEGVDIHVRSFDFKTTFYATTSNVTTAYIRQLFQLTSRVNSDTVNINIDDVTLSFDAGELLFLGAEGQKRKGYGDWELTCNWSALPNEDNLTIGDITGISKLGWEYLWVYSEPTVTSGSLVLTPSQVNVEQVYDYKALSPILLSSSFGTPSGFAHLT